MVLDARFTDETLYAQETIAGTETDGAQNFPFKALWKKLEEFGLDAPLYPDGLLNALQ
jgi:hypothetical protein